MAPTLVVAPSDVVGLLEVWIDELAFELVDGLNVVELQRVLVSILNLQFGPGHVDVHPGFLALFLQLVDYFPQDHGADPGAKTVAVGKYDLVIVTAVDLRLF